MGARAGEHPAGGHQGRGLRGTAGEHEPVQGALRRGTDERTLADAVRGADVFLGLSGKDVLSPAMLRSMAERPVVFACANPDPEIRYELARETRRT